MDQNTRPGGRSAAAAAWSCEGCGSPAVSLLHRSVRNSLLVGRCRSCRLVSVLNLPRQSELVGQYEAADQYDAYIAAQRVSALHLRYERTIRRLTELLVVAGGRPSVFDVGAGAGAFLSLCRSAGYDVYGNEVSPQAARLCAERHGIRLSDKELHDEPGDSRFDAMTMWCVIAHVEEPRAMLADAARLLSPGGVLFLQTPRWCLLDVAGLGLTRLSRGRLSHVTERRINSAHLRLYSVGNLSAMLIGLGLEVVAMRSTCDYSLHTSAYLAGMHVPAYLHGPVSAGAEMLIDKKIFARNNLDVYARKPGVSTPA